MLGLNTLSVWLIIKTMEIQTLEQRAKICATKVKIMKSAYVPPERKDCRRICNGFNYDCPDYLASQVAEIPINQGKYYLQLQ
jgi:hypothetical protein